MNAIIEKTALFVSTHGTQMEIVIKAKQANNPLFAFLAFDHSLNPYYKNMVQAIKSGKYVPQPVSSHYASREGELFVLGFFCDTSLYYVNRVVINILPFN